MEPRNSKFDRMIGHEKYMSNIEGSMGRLKYTGLILLIFMNYSEKFNQFYWINDYYPLGQRSSSQWAMLVGR